MKKIVVLGIIFLVSCNFVFAQKKKRRNKGEKISLSVLLNTDFNNTKFYMDSPIHRIIEPFDTRLRGIQRNIQSIPEMVNFGFSYQKLNKNNKYTELALTKFVWSRDETETIVDGLLPFPQSVRGSLENDFKIAFRYEYGSYFAIHDESRLRMGLGGGLAPYLIYSKFTPKASADFPRRVIRYGLKLEIVPSLSYRISKNGFIDLKWSPSIFDFNRHYGKVENPIFTKAQRKNVHTIPVFFGNLLSFQLHYRHQILSPRDARKKLSAQRRQKVDEKGKKKGVTFVTPILNINPRKEDLFFSYSKGHLDYTNPINRISRLNLGIGVQFVKKNGIYHEIALSRLSIKQDISVQVVRFPEVPDTNFPTEIFESEANEWGIGVRYEIGKVFTDPYRNKQKVIFSVGLAVEPFYNNFESDDWTQIRVTDYGAELKLMPAIAFKLSDSNYLQFKWAPTAYRVQYFSSEFNSDLEMPKFFKNDERRLDAATNMVNLNIGLRMRI